MEELQYIYGKAQRAAAERILSEREHAKETGIRILRHAAWYVSVDRRALDFIIAHIEREFLCTR